MGAKNSRDASDGDGNNNCHHEVIHENVNAWPRIFNQFDNLSHVMGAAQTTWVKVSIEHGYLPFQH